MTSIAVPKLIAVDTSTLAGLASDLSTAAQDRRRTGESFVAELSARGWLPVISFENIMEMLRHGDAQTVNDRISMFARFPQVAHVDSLRYPGMPGSIVDVLAREVRVFLSDKTSDVLSIARAVRSDLFAFCDGRRITKWLNENVGILRPLVQHDHPREKLLASLSHLDILAAGDMKVGNSPADSQVDRAVIERHRTNLRRYMRTHLDLQGVTGVDHDAFADQFALDCEARLLAMLGPHGSCTFGDLRDKLLREQGIDPAQVTDNTTVNEIAAMASFDHRLEVASGVLGLFQPVTARDIPVEKCPSQIVETGVQRRRRSAPRAQAGDLFDSHLSTLACYCDLTIVDKRTREYLRQLRSQSKLARGLLGKVVSLSRYTDLIREE